MITWIQQTFQQHFRIIFAVLLGVTIISFIFTIGAAPGIGRADREVLKRPFFGLNLGSEEDKQKVFGDANTSVYLIAGYTALDEGRLQQYAFNRYASVALADQLHLPPPSETEITEHIKGMQRFAGENGQFDAKKYSEFRDSLKKNSRITEADLSRVLSDDIRAERAQKLLGGPGYVLPSEVKRELTLADTNWTLGVASFDYASFNPTINPTEADISKYFEEKAAQYEIPPKVSVSYVDFPATAFVSQVNVTEPDVRAYYDSNPARFPKPTPAADPTKPAVPPTPADPAADYAAVRPQVEAALRMERAQRLATKEASDFAVLLFERKVAFGSPEIANLVSQRHAVLKDLPPFAENEMPPVFGGNPQIAEEAFRLNKERFFSDALPTDSGSVILFWKETIPSRQPTLAEVRAKVSADYIAEEKRKRFVEIGRNVRSLIATRLKAGEPFEKAVEAVASSQGLKAEAKMHPAFTLRQRPQDLDMSALNALEHLEKGELSEMVHTQNAKGLLVYAADKKVPEINESNPQYATTRTQLAQFTAQRTTGEYLRQMIDVELAKSAPAAQ